MQPSHQPNNIIAKKYQIINTLGEGGSGITYLAQDLQNNKNVALKALSLHRINDWKALELFEREAKILAQLNHQAIPQYLEYFDAETDGEKHFYIAQQLAPGDSLTKLVENNWRTNEQQVKDIAAQILEILIYLHSLKPPVTHRDIKPQNIIRNQDGKVFLVDFGAVQDTYYSTFMRGSTVVGTYGYMAPEQFRGQSVPATDLYGLGATLLFLLTHRSPADFPTDGLKIDFRSRVQVSDDFADWLDKMLEPDLEERFASAKVALEVLRGKRKIIAVTNKPILWKAAMGIGASLLFTVGIFYNYKWAILDRLGFKPAKSICTNSSQMINYINRGGNPNLFIVDDNTNTGKSLLLCAIDANLKELAESLIVRGANANQALISLKSIDDVNFLIAKGADINSKYYLNQTLLHHAVETNRKELVELLLYHNVKINVKDDFGNAPLHFTAAKFIAFTNPKLGSFETSYQKAELDEQQQKIRIDILKLLLKNGADTDIKDRNGYTPLHLAADTNNKDVAKYLIEGGANVNAKNKFGETPLRVALSENEDMSIIQLLIVKGADVNVKDSQGKSVLDIAREADNKKLIEIIEKQ